MTAHLRPVVIATAITALVVGAFWISFGSPTAVAGSAAPARLGNLIGDTTPLANASETCGAGELADDDETLIIDVAGTDVGSGDDIVDGLACVLVTLDAPTSVTAQMDATRALDGMQTAEWDGVLAQWTYHPDDGLDVILTES
jgi:hypothetical protein